MYKYLILIAGSWTLQDISYLFIQRKTLKM